MNILKRIERMGFDCPHCKNKLVSIEGNERIDDAKNIDEIIQYCTIQEGGKIELIIATCSCCHNKNYIEKLTIENNGLLNIKDGLYNEGLFSFKKDKKEFIAKGCEFYQFVKNKCFYYNIKSRESQYPELIENFNYFNDVNQLMLPRPPSNDSILQAVKKIQEISPIKLKQLFCFNYFCRDNLDIVIQSLQKSYDNCFIIDNTILNIENQYKLFEAQIFGNKIKIEKEKDFLEFDSYSIKYDIVRFLFKYVLSNNSNEISDNQYLYASFNLNKKEFLSHFENNLDEKTVKEITQITKDNIKLFISYNENRTVIKKYSNKFCDIIKKHVRKIPNEKWDYYASIAQNGTLFTEEFENERDDIINLSREDFVESWIVETQIGAYDSIKLDRELEKVGEIDGENVYYHPEGIYFYDNKKIGLSFNVILTSPAHIQNW